MFGIVEAAPKKSPEDKAEAEVWARFQDLLMRTGCSACSAFIVIFESLPETKKFWNKNAWPLKF